jgi:RarD protein
MKTDRLKLITAMLIFGTIGLVRRQIPYASGTVALVRAVVGVAFLLAWVFVRREHLHFEGFRKKAWVLILSGVAIAANWIFLFEAYRFTTVSVATLCYYMAPIFVILLSPILLKEKLTPIKMVAVVIAFVGMLFLSGVIEEGFSGLTGIMLGLSAGLLYATVMILNKKMGEVGGLERTIVQLGVSAIALIPYVVFAEGLPAPVENMSVYLWLVLAGVVHTGMAYAFYFGSMKNLPAQTVALYSYIDPIIAVVLSVAVLGEHMSILALFGGCLVLGATVLSERGHS